MKQSKQGNSARCLVAVFLILKLILLIIIQSFYLSKNWNTIANFTWEKDMNTSSSTANQEPCFLNET